MIQAEQIRLGNWFEHDCVRSYRNNGILLKNLFQFQWTIKDWQQLDSKKVSPIPLTSDIFRKCGFEEDGLYRYKKINFTMIEWDEGIYFLNGNLDFRIKYLHQLQNIYSFTGQELIYTP